MSVPASPFVCWEIASGSEAYLAAHRLREEVLRKPLDLDWSDADLQAEEEATHLGCFAQDRLVAALLLHPQDAETLRLRQVAVAPAFRRRGAGAQLVAFAEYRAMAFGYRRMFAHARLDALPFYRSLGYSKFGARFIEHAIPHVAVHKTLASS